MTHHRLRICDLYHAWCACYHGRRHQGIDYIAAMMDLRRGTVYAVLWRLGLIGVDRSEFG